MSEEITLNGFTDGEANDEKAVDVGSLQQLEASPISEWSLNRLGSLLTLEYGDSLTSDSREDGEIPVFGSNGQVDTHSEPAIDEPGIIMGRKGSIGEIEFSEEPFWPIDTTYYLTRKETDENLRFLYYLLQNIQLERLNAASAIPGLNRNDAYGLNALIPPLSEQHKIATVLYTVDQAMEKTEEIKRQIERVRDGVSQDVFSRGIRELGAERTDNEFKKTYLGTVPEDWQFRRVDEVCSHVVDCPHSTPNYSEQGTLVVRTSEIENGRYYPTESPRVDEEGYQKRISRLEPKPGDVVFTREAPIGEAFKIPEGMELCLGQRLMQLRPKEGVLDADFLVELIYSDMMQSWFERSARGSTSTHVNVGDIESMEIPVPPIEEQQRIVDVLGGFREQLDSERNLLSRYERLKQGLMQDLLSGTVRTTDTNIEVPDEVAQHG